MYKIANKAEVWFTYGFFMLFLLVIGQIIEFVFPRSVLVVFGAFAFCGLGIILCSAYTTIYDKGKEAATKELEPDE